MNEQQCIQLLFTRIQSGESVVDLIPSIEEQHAKSVVVQYYLGFYYEKQGYIQEAQDQFRKCIGLNHFFTPPYFHIVNYLVGSGGVLEAYKLIQVIFCKKTIDPTNGRGVKTFKFKENFQLCSLLFDPLVRAKYHKEAKKLYQTMLEHVEEVPLQLMDDMQKQGYKILCSGLGQLYVKTDSFKSFQYYKRGLDLQSRFTELDKQVLQGLLVACNYNLERDISKYQLYLNTITNKLYPVVDNHIVANEKRDKIRIGYFSPDFNKNAVGLFITPLLKYVDHTKFEVYCYYNYTETDMYTDTLKQYPGIQWRIVADMSDEQLYFKIKFEDKIDILVDLIVHGIGGRVNVMAQRPAPYIVNYLGFPDTSRLNCYTHRITDTICDKASDDKYTETLVKLKKCAFVCWHLFENEYKTPIRPPQRRTQLHIGIFNKDAKQHTWVRELWRSILKSNKEYVLCVKLAEGETIYNTCLNGLYADFPSSQVTYLPFTSTLQEYYTQFNDIDICLDTFPYSGTTTTCSSLFMGVPVVTMYDPNAIQNHVSNVTASILTHAGLAECIARDQYEYKHKVDKFLKQWKAKSIEEKVSAKERVRTMFLESMNPRTFMKEYETILEGIVQHNGDEQSTIREI